MRWLIVEDALRDRKGHWLEWVTTFAHGFRELGDEVRVLADASVEPDIRDSLRPEPILPGSIWHRLGDGSGLLTRYARVFTHNWSTWRVMNQYLRAHTDFDAIFVPTVSLHHLLAWTRLIKGTLRQRKTRVLLFFLIAPVSRNAIGDVVSDGSPTARLLFGLLRTMASEIRSGKVVLGVETKAMQHACEQLTGLPFIWFPQPVTPAEDASRAPGAWIEMACLGAARAEKGSDILQDAIKLHRHQHPNSRARFTFQWMDDFQVDGRPVRVSPELQQDPHVSILNRYFADGEYVTQLQRTSVMLLPYRLSSYALRGSRVVIDAVVNGIPVIVTGGTTLADTAEEFGAAICCRDGDPQNLAAAIAQMESCFDAMRQRALNARGAALERFSVREFRRIFQISASLAAIGKTGQAGTSAAAPVGQIR